MEVRVKYEAEVKQALRAANGLALAIKANGGYRYRERLKVSEIEAKQICENSEMVLRELMMRLGVAEAMLKEPPPSFHARWDEYQGRLADARRML